MGPLVPGACSRVQLTRIEIPHKVFDNIMKDVDIIIIFEIKSLLCFANYKGMPSHVCAGLETNNNLSARLWRLALFTLRSGLSN